MENETKKASLAMGIICGVIGLFLLGIPMGCIAVGIGNEVRKENNNWGWVAIALGAFDIIGGLIAAVAMLGS